MKKIIFPLLILSALALAAGKKKSEHREHEAHVHGSATLAIAFDKTKGQIEFKAAAEGVLGFEHEAKSEADKATLAAAVAKFEKPAELFQFPPDLMCQFSKDKVGLVPDGKHADFVANYQVSCQTAPTRSKMQVDFSAFPGLKDVDITVLSDTTQQSIEARKMPTTIQF